MPDNHQNSTNTYQEKPVFSVKFTNTVDDLAEWNDFVVRATKVYTYFHIITLVLLDILIITLFFNFFKKIDQVVLFIILLLLLIPIQFYIAFFTKAGKNYSDSVRKRVARSRVATVAKNSDGFLEEREMIFFDDKFITKHVNKSGERNYNSILDLKEEKDYLFLRLSKLQAIILPKKYFTNEQIDFIKSKVTTKN